MNDLIRFRPAKRPRRSAPGDRSAQILFFTGVRYHRTSEDARAATVQAASGVQRKGEGGEAGERNRTPRR
jgi:hypothetical protein